MLSKLGASFAEGGRHERISLEIDGTLVFLTVLSRGSKDIPIGTAKSIFRELHISGNLDHCIALRNCPMTRDEYVELLRRMGVLQSE